MPTDPRKLRPGELCRYLNLTPLGEVISPRQLHRHRTRAGLRIGEGRYVDLLRYVTRCDAADGRIARPSPVSLRQAWEAKQAQRRNAGL